MPAQRQPLFKIAGRSLLLPPTPVTTRNPPLLKRLPFKSRFRAELQLCVKPGSHLMCDGEWALGSRKQLSLSWCRITMLTNPVKGPRRLWLAMSRCFHTSAAALASHVPGDRLSDECGLPEKESGGRGGKKKSPNAIKSI